MKKSTVISGHVLLLDDNPLTAMYVLRLFTYMQYQVTYVDQARFADTLAQGKTFDVILINLAVSCDESSWIPACTLSMSAPVISYTPHVLIHDFMQTALQGNHASDDGWMLNSELFHFFTSLDTTTMQLKG